MGASLSLREEMWAPPPTQHSLASLPRPPPVSSGDPQADFPVLSCSDYPSTFFSRDQGISKHKAKEEPFLSASTSRSYCVYHLRTQFWLKFEKLWGVGIAFHPACYPATSWIRRLGTGLYTDVIDCEPQPMQPYFIS